MHRRFETFSFIAGMFAGCLGPIAQAHPIQQVQPDRLVQIVAEEMCCKGCAQKVSGQLYSARGVKAVEIDMNTRTVSVSLMPHRGATLGQLWHAVEQGEGGPTKLITVEATYTLSRPTAEINGIAQNSARAPVSIVIDNLHCKGCAQKIAAQLYAIKGVTKVSVDLQQETLFVQARDGEAISPWQIVMAVAQANERPLAIHGPHGTLAIEWATKRAPKNHQQAQQTTIGGIQR